MKLLPLLLLGVISGFAPRGPACRRRPRPLAAEPDALDDVERLEGRLDDLEGRLRQLTSADELAIARQRELDKIDETDSVLGAAALAAAGALSAGLDTDVAIAVPAVPTAADIWVDHLDVEHDPRLGTGTGTGTT